MIWLVATAFLNLPCGDRATILQSLHQQRYEVVVTGRDGQGNAVRTFGHSDGTWMTIVETEVEGRQLACYLIEGVGLSIGRST